MTVVANAGRCVEGCMNGRYATKHVACNGQGCEECSTVEKHGIAGRVLCKYCGGEGDSCRHCGFTGLFLRFCVACQGTGVYSHRTQKNVVPARKKEKTEEFGSVSEEVLDVLNKVEM